MRYFHSVHLIESKCKGCVNCIKRCPTEAIRVRGGKASILEEKCIDCGECIRICPNKAKEVLADKLEAIRDYRYVIALPAPAIYGQFREGTSPEKILSALTMIGFDEVLDVAFAADLIAVKTREIIQKSNIRPIISSACPAVVRLIQVRFPNLVEHIAPVLTPMEVAGRLAKVEAMQKTGLREDEIGAFFISPCPGKVSAVKQPEGLKKTYVDGAIPISTIFPLVRELLSKADIREKQPLRRGSGTGMGWGRAGGENLSIGADKHLAVDGIHNVIEILDDIERGKLAELNYIEAQACVGGCVGGVLSIENPFITRRRLRIIASEANQREKTEDQVTQIREDLEKEYLYEFDTPIAPRPTMKLDDDMKLAIQKLTALEQIVENLPGLDCGSCGTPSCRALAEDIVRGLAFETDCVFKLREKVQLLAEELMQAAAQMPSSMGAKQKSAEQNEDTGNSTGT
jgi:iron only hydrogenase large subunit-like protein